MWATWPSAVRSVITRRSAISRLECPAATSAATSRSRGARGPPSPSPPPAAGTAGSGAALSAYLLAALDGPRSVLTHVDLPTGATRRLASIPGLSVGLAVTEERIYLPRSDGDSLLALHRRSGRVEMASIPVGRRPVGLSLGTG
jgi:hypothetical protein